MIANGFYKQKKMQLESAVSNIPDLQSVQEPFPWIVIQIKVQKHTADWLTKIVPWFVWPSLDSSINLAVFIRISC